MNNYKDSIKLCTGIKLKIVLLVPQTQLLYYTCTAKATHTKLTQRLKADYYECSFTNCRQPYCYLYSVAKLLCLLLGGKGGGGGTLLELESN